MNKTLAIIGLGYVGLPLAAEFGKKHRTIGFDINTTRISELEQGIDKTLEIDSENLNLLLIFHFHLIPKDLAQCNIFIDDSSYTG